MDRISGLPLCELTTSVNRTDASIAKEILIAANEEAPLREYTFLADKSYDVRDVYEGEALIPLNKRNTKGSKKMPAGNLICETGLAMHKNGKTSDVQGDLRQKYCCPFRQSQSGECPCNHKCWNNGRKNRGCIKYLIIPDDYQLSIVRDCLRFKRHTLCASSVSVKTLVSKARCRSAFGYAMVKVPPI